MFRRDWFFALIVVVLAPTACKTIIDPVPPGPRWSSAALGLFHTGGLVDDTAYCFGDDRSHSPARMVTCADSRRQATRIAGSE